MTGGMRRKAGKADNKESNGGNSETGDAQPRSKGISASEKPVLPPSPLSQSFVS